MGLLTDREKVIKGLDHCAKEADCRGCIYQEQMKGRSDGCDCMREALALLKEQPEIVRCKDCMWWKNGLCESDDVTRKIDDCGCYPDFRTDSDWFCADGERKEGL